MNERQIYQTEKGSITDEKLSYFIQFCFFCFVSYSVNNILAYYSILNQN